MKRPETIHEGCLLLLHNLAIDSAHAADWLGQSVQPSLHRRRVISPVAFGCIDRHCGCEVEKPDPTSCVHLACKSMPNVFPNSLLSIILYFGVGSCNVTYFEPLAGRNHRRALCMLLQLQTSDHDDTAVVLHDDNAPERAAGHDARAEYQSSLTSKCRARHLDQHLVTSSWQHRDGCAGSDRLLSPCPTICLSGQREHSRTIAQVCS